MMPNKRNKEEVAERYRHSLPHIIETIKETSIEKSQDAYDLVTDKVLEQWHQIMRRRPNMRTPHWNTSLEYRWKKMMKARSRAKRSNIRIDWEIFEYKRNQFLKENRRAKRRFRKRTEELLDKGQNNIIADAVRGDKRRREERLK